MHSYRACLLHTRWPHDSEAFPGQMKYANPQRVLGSRDFWEPEKKKKLYGAATLWAHREGGRGIGGLGGRQRRGSRSADSWHRRLILYYWWRRITIRGCIYMQHICLLHLPTDTNVRCWTAEKHLRGHRVKSSRVKLTRCITDWILTCLQVIWMTVLTFLWL